MMATAGGLAVATDISGNAANAATHSQPFKHALPQVDRDSSTEGHASTGSTESLPVETWPVPKVQLNDGCIALLMLQNDELTRRVAAIETKLSNHMDGPSADNELDKKLSAAMVDFVNFRRQLELKLDFAVQRLGTELQKLGDAVQDLTIDFNANKLNEVADKVLDVNPLTQRGAPTNRSESARDLNHRSDKPDVMSPRVDSVRASLALHKSAILRKTDACEIRLSNREPSLASGLNAEQHGKTYERETSMRDRRVSDAKSQSPVRNRILQGRDTIQRKSAVTPRQMPRMASLGSTTILRDPAEMGVAGINRTLGPLAPVRRLTSTPSTDLYRLQVKSSHSLHDAAPRIGVPKLSEINTVFCRSSG